MTAKIGTLADEFSVNATSLLTAAHSNTADAYAAVPGMSDELQTDATMAVKLSYVAGFRLVYLIAIGFGGAAMVASACTITTDKSLKNDERAVHLKNEVQEEPLK